MYRTLVSVHVPQPHPSVSGSPLDRGFDDDGARWTPGSLAPAAVPVRYAGFWRRYVAGWIDSLVLSPLQLMLWYLLTLPLNQCNLEEPAGLNLWKLVLGTLLLLAAWFLLGMLIGWIYAAAMLSSSRQATLGMLALGIVATGLSGERISFARASGRHFASYLSQATFWIGFLMQPFTERRQALHDLIANTLVIRR